jgi:hypothetical protein
MSGVESLLSAAESGNLSLVDELISGGVNVDGTVPQLRFNRESFAGPALTVAASRGHSNVVAALINARANVEKRDAAGETALFKGARFGSAAVVRQLMRAGANINTCNRYEESALCWAVRDGRKAVTKVLILAGAALGAGGGSALFGAIEDWRLSEIAILLAAGANTRGAMACAAKPSPFNHEAANMLQAVGVRCTDQDLALLPDDEDDDEDDDDAWDKKTRQSWLRLTEGGSSSHGKRLIQRALFELVRDRFLEIGIGLQSVGLPALLTTMIFEAACAPFTLESHRPVSLPFHCLWNTATKIKHFRSRGE